MPIAEALHARFLEETGVAPGAASLGRAVQSQTWPPELRDSSTGRANREPSLQHAPSFEMRADPGRHEKCDHLPYSRLTVSKAR
jgi:hypothetical protein